MGGIGTALKFIENSWNQRPAEVPKPTPVKVAKVEEVVVVKEEEIKSEPV